MSVPALPSKNFRIHFIQTAPICRNTSRRPIICRSATGLSGCASNTDNQTPAIDFLYASGATASTESPEVNFRNENATGGNDPTLGHSFHHCMSQITLTFEAGSGVDFSTIQPESYTLAYSGAYPFTFR